MDPPLSPNSREYQKLRRWNLPKGEWLQTAESGHPPGPGYRDMGASMSPRSCGPSARFASGAMGSSASRLPPVEAAHPLRTGKPSMSETIGSFYSPRAAGLNTTNIGQLAGTLTLPPRPASAPMGATGAGFEAEDTEADAAAAEGALPPTSFMPLEIFDSPDFEPLGNLEEWELIDAKAAAGAPVCARSRYHETATSGCETWQPCEVLAYSRVDRTPGSNNATAQFLVRWLGSGKQKWATRFNVLFDGEEEGKLVERREAARRLRAEVEAAGRYRLFANEKGHLGASASSMTEDLEAATGKRVMGEPAKAAADGSSPPSSPPPKRYSRLGPLQQARLLDELRAEARDEYDAAMRRAQLDYKMLSADFNRQVGPLALTAPAVPVVPESGVIQVAEEKASFEATRGAIDATLFVAKVELLGCWREAFQECAWMREPAHLLFDAAPTAIERPAPLPLFAGSQEARLRTMTERLKTQWVLAEEAVVERTVGDANLTAGLGAEEYDGSLVQRLLRQVTQLMQDELQRMVLTSVEAMLTLLGECATPPAELDAEAEKWVHALPPATPALLQVALRLVDGELVFQPSLDEVRAGLAHTMRALLSETAGVPQLQPGSFVRYNLPQAWLGTLRTEDERFLHAQAQLHVLLDTSLQRPQQLHQMLLTEFAELASLDEATYLDELQQQKLELDGYGAAITKWRTTAQRAGAACPADVHCRLLLVQCSELQEALADKARALAVGVGGLVAKELFAIAEEIGSKYETIHSKLAVSSTNAEEVTAMKEYLESCSVELTQHQEAIDSELSTRVALLSSFHHSLPDETFDAVQRTLGWPAKLDRVVAEADKQAQEDRDNFMEALRNERDRFAEELEAWELEIKDLSKLGDMAETETNSDLVAQLQAKLEQGRVRAAENNSREELFGWPLTEYPQLNELTANLEPYLALWTTAVNFQRAYPVWMEGPLLNLSPEQVEADVASWSRQLYKMGKTLVGLDGPLRVVAHVKLKLDEFSEHIPLLQCILNPGMRERHWKKLAENTGVTTAQPTAMTTLFSLLEQKVGDQP